MRVTIIYSSQLKILLYFIFLGTSFHLEIRDSLSLVTQGSRDDYKFIAIRLLGTVA